MSNPQSNDGQNGEKDENTGSIKKLAETMLDLFGGGSMEPFGPFNPPFKGVSHGDLLADKEKEEPKEQ
jgi:hypothetical protein